MKDEEDKDDEGKVDAFVKMMGMEMAGMVKERGRQRRVRGKDGYWDEEGKDKDRREK